MASVSITGTTGSSVTNTDNSISDATVDNGSKGYYIYCQLDPASGAGDIQLQMFRIAYTVNNLKQTI